MVGILGAIRTWVGILGDRVGVIIHGVTTLGVIIHGVTTPGDTTLGRPIGITTLSVTLGDTTHGVIILGDTILGDTTHGGIMVGEILTWVGTLGEITVGATTMAGTLGGTITQVAASQVTGLTTQTQVIKVRALEHRARTIQTITM